LENLERFDLDNTERSLFKQFSTTGYYTGLIRNSSIPDNVMLQNTGANTPFNLPNLPGLYAIDATGVPGLLNVLYGSTTPLPVDQVKADIVASINRLNTAGTFPTTTPEFVVFENHSPFVFTVPVSAIAGGFYKRLNALQGHRQMFYTGATFQTQDSSLIWQFTEGLLPQVVA
jgi:hypothetical protein